jgi:hypothetical protein
MSDAPVTPVGSITVTIPDWLARMVAVACARMTGGGPPLSTYVAVAVKEKLEREADGGD